MDAIIPGDNRFEGDSDFGGMIKGDVTLAPDAHVRLRGMVKGDVLLLPGARLDLLGMVKGDLTAEQGAHAVITGALGGEVINHGGTVEAGDPFDLI